jgi:Tfp pilus assembly protein FimT
MRRSDQGFSTVETLLVLVVIATITGLGFWVYRQNHTKTTANSSNSSVAGSTSSPATTSAAPGTTASIDSLTTQDVNSEQSIDSKYSNNDQTNAASANAAASNLGGAYDETSF